MVVKGKEASDGRNQDKDRHGQKEIGYWKKEIGHNPHCHQGNNRDPTHQAI